MFRFFSIIIAAKMVFILLTPQISGQVGTWKTFTNTNHINDVTSEGDTLWVATTGGVVTFDLKTKSFINTYTNIDGLSHVTVTSILIDRKNHIWFGTDGGGISKWKRHTDTWRNYTEFDGIALHVRTLWHDGAIMWVGTEAGVSFLRWGWDWEEKDTSYVWKENYDTRNGLPSDIVTSFATDDTMVWVGTVGGVASALKISNLKDPSSWTTYTTDNGLLSSEVFSLAIYDSYVWVGTDRGVSYFDGVHWTVGELAECRVYSLKILAGTLWAGTSKGVYRLQDNQWIVVGQESLPSQDVRVLMSSEKTNIVCGMWGMGLAEFNGTSWLQYATKGPWKNNCLSVAVDPQGFVWCGVRDNRFRGKLSRYHTDDWTHFDENDGIENGEGVFSIMVDRLGKKWFGTWGDGVSMLDDNGTLVKEDDVLTVFYASNSGLHGIPDDPNFEVIAAIDEDDQGNVWFGNYFFGLVMYSPQDDLWESFTTADGLADWLVLSLAVAGEEHVWIGTEQNGVSLLNNGGTPFLKNDDAWETFHAENGFTNSTVNSVVSGEGSLVWFGTNDGLYSYNGEEFQQNSDIQNTGVLSLALDTRQNLWAGTSGQGVYVFNRFGTFRVQYTAENSGLINNAVNDIDFNDETGEVWMATPLGLSRYESGVVALEGKGEKINFFPNPFLPAQGHTEITFFQLPINPSLRIYTVSGEFIIELQPLTQSPDLITWNGENQSGQDVASGIYIVVLTATGEDPRIAKLAIIR